MIAFPNLRHLDAPVFFGDGGDHFPRVFRSAALYHYGLAGINYIERHLNVGVHIDLRGKHEYERDHDLIRKAQQRFSKVVLISITTDTPSPSGEWPTAQDYLEYYRSILTRPAGLAQAYIEVVKHIDEGVLFSCSQGKDRTGLLTAALLEGAGQPRSAILRDFGQSSKELVNGSLVEPRSWHSKGLEREAYLRRYDLGDTPLSLLFDSLDRDGTCLVDLLRSHASDRDAFDAASRRLRSV